MQVTQPEAGQDVSPSQTPPGGPSVAHAATTPPINEEHPSDRPAAYLYHTPLTPRRAGGRSNTFLADTSLEPPSNVTRSPAASRIQPQHPLWRAPSLNSDPPHPYSFSQPAPTRQRSTITPPRVLSTPVRRRLLRLDNLDEDQVALVGGGGGGGNYYDQPLGSSSSSSASSSPSFLRTRTWSISSEPNADSPPRLGAPHYTTYSSSSDDEEPSCDLPQPASAIRRPSQSRSQSQSQPSPPRLSRTATDRPSSSAPPIITRRSSLEALAYVAAREHSAAVASANAEWEMERLTTRPVEI